MSVFKLSPSALDKFSSMDAEEVTVNLDATNSSQVINSGEKLFSKVTINLPETLKGENIKQGVNIAGISGTLPAQKAEQTKTVTPTTSQQVVKPDTGKALSQVTVKAIPSTYVQPTGNVNITGTSAVDVTNYATATVQDADLVAGNIKNGVNILGVVGTYEGSGGGSAPNAIVTGVIDGSDVTDAYVGKFYVRNESDVVESSDNPSTITLVGAIQVPNESTEDKCTLIYLSGDYTSDVSSCYVCTSINDAINSENNLLIGSGTPHLVVKSKGQKFYVAGINDSEFASSFSASIDTYSMTVNSADFIASDIYNYSGAFNGCSEESVYTDSATEISLNSQYSNNNILGNLVPLSLVYPDDGGSISNITVKYPGALQSHVTVAGCTYQSTATENNYIVDTFSVSDKYNMKLIVLDSFAQIDGFSIYVQAVLNN